jgi:hypothetical protein
VACVKEASWSTPIGPVEIRKSAHDTTPMFDVREVVVDKKSFAGDIGCRNR